jgi:hypothetical protein
MISWYQISLYDFRASLEDKHRISEWGPSLHYADQTLRSITVTDSFSDITSTCSERWYIRITQLGHLFTPKTNTASLHLVLHLQQQVADLCWSPKKENLKVRAMFVCFFFFPGGLIIEETVLGNLVLHCAWIICDNF